MAWVVDTAHSQIQFSARHMMITTVRGSFKKYEATVTPNEAHPEKSTVEVNIDANSIETGESQRDGHLRSPDFLDVAQYPTITFRSKRIEFNGNNLEQFKLIGDLTIHGTTKEITLEVTNEGAAKDPFGNQKRAFSTSTTISRKDFGLTWNVALEAGGWLVSDQIKVSIDIQLVEKAPEAATAAH